MTIWNLKTGTFCETKEEFFAKEYEVQKEKIKQLKEEIKSLENEISELNLVAEKFETICKVTNSN